MTTDLSTIKTSIFNAASDLTLCATLASRLWKRTDLIAAHHQPDPVLQLLKLAAIDRDGLFADAEQPSDLDLNRLSLEADTGRFGATCCRFARLKISDTFFRGRPLFPKPPHFRALPPLRVEPTH